MSQEKIDKETLDALRAQITKQVIEEMASKDEREKQERMIEREREREIHDKYISKMKESADPWVEIIGGVEQTEQGVRIALEWNSAFVQYLKDQGVSGADEEQVVQHWVTLLLHDMAEQMEGDDTQTSDFT